MQSFEQQMLAIKNVSLETFVIDNFKVSFLWNFVPFKLSFIGKLLLI